MKDFLKRILAVVLAVAMVLTGLPAMGVAKTTEVLAAGSSLEDFDPELEFYHVKSSKYPVANMSDYIYYVIADGNQSFKDRTQGTVATYGTIYLNQNKNYCRYKDGSWYVDLTLAIPDLVGWINGTKDGRKYKLFYGLFNGYGQQWYDKMQPTETMKDDRGKDVKGCENKNTPEFRSAGIHATASDYSDIKCICQVESGAEGGLVIENIAVELHTVNWDNATRLYQTYYTKVHWDPVVYADDPEWVWEKGTTTEYLDSATATFVTDRKKEDGSSYNIVVKDEDIESYKDGVKTVFKAEADFTGTDVETKESLTNGKATSTKTFDQPVVNCDEAIQAGKTQNSAPNVSATFWRSGLTPTTHIDPGWNDAVSVEHYDRPATAVVQNDNETKAHLFGQTTQAFGASVAGTETVKRTYDVSWSWADDYSTATVTFTNSSDSHSPYTVNFNSSDLSDRDNGDGTKTFIAEAYFGGTKFTGTSAPVNLTVTYRNFFWNWIPKDTNNDGAADDFDCTVSFDKYVGENLAESITNQPATVIYDNFATDKTLDATYTYTADNETFKASDTQQNLAFTGPTWVWDETEANKYMEADATFKETTGNVPDTEVSGQAPIKNDTFVIKSKTVNPATGCKMTHSTPEQQADKSYKWTHTANVQFCKAPFSDVKTETAIPTIDLDKEFSGATNDFDNGWEWSAYDAEARNFTATAHLKASIERWKVVQRANGVEEKDIKLEKDTWTEVDEDTVYGGEKDVKAIFEGQVTTTVGSGNDQVTKTFTSPKRKFVKDSSTKIEFPTTGNPTCTFTFTEVKGTAQADGDADNSGWHSFGNTVQLSADTIEAVGGYETDSQDPTKFMQKYKATVDFARSKTTPQTKVVFTQEDYKHGIDPNTETVWEWGVYDPQKDTYPVKYWIKSTLTNEILDGGTAGIPGLLKAEKKTDGNILLTAYDEDATSPKGYQVIPDTRTVKAPPTWDWNITDANKNMTVTATFEQIGGGSEWNRKMIPFDSADDPYKHVKLTHDTPVPSTSNPGKYDWNHHATVTFCGLEYESGDQTEIVVPMPSVIPPPPTVTPGPDEPEPTPIPDEPEPTPIPDIEKFDDKDAYGGSDNWYWNKYKENEQEIPAFALVADWIDRWSSLEPDNTERNYLTPRVLSDDETALAQNSAGVKSDGKKKDSTGGNRVYFQGEVVANRYNDNGKEVEQKLSSQEREFNCSNNTAWNADKTDITFTFTETPAYRLKDSAKDTKVQLTASAMAALGDDHGGFEYGPYQPDDKNAGKLKRSVWAYVYFGHQQFWSSEATQDNIDPDSIEVAWKWNKYDRANDQYTAEYEVTALKENEKGVTERIVMPKESALNPVVAVATKVAEDSGVLLTANLPSTSIYKKYEKLNKLVEKDKTKNAYGPNWAWETKNDTKKYLEATATFTDDLSSTIAPYTLTSDTPARMTITHDTPVFNESTKKYDWQHYATVTFCGLEFKASQQSGWEVDITPTPIVVTPTPGGSMDSKKKADDNWYWDSYKEVEQEIPATVKVAYTIDRWKVAKPAEVTSEALEPMAVETDNETALTKESGVGGIDKEGKGNNKVVFQGEAETIDSEKKLLSEKRTFTNTDRSGWNTEATECVFTFTESSTGYTLRETVKVTANAANEALGIAGFEYGPLVPDPKSGREGLFKRSIWAYVDFGHQRFWSTEGEQTGIPGDYEIEWNWHSYDPNADSYTVDYKVYLLKAAEHTIAPTRVELTDERGSVEAVATKDKDGNITLTASVPTSKKYSSSKDNPSVRKVAAPVWNWSKDFTKAPATFVEDATAFAVEHARTDWGETSHVKNPAKIDISKYRIKSLDPELYERTHSAEVTFCKLNFDSEKDQEIKPSFDIPKVTATPTPVPSTPGDGTPTPTPTPKPGEPTPTPKPDTYTTNTVSWTWADYKERLNNTSATDTPNKGNFESATATLTDDQTGFFTKRITAVGTKSGVGGITIDPTGTENPATKTFTAKVENKKTDGTTEQLSDLLTFKKPAASDWTWTGVDSATVKFKEASGKKTFGHLKDTVEITTDDIEKEYNGVGANGQAEFVYTATAYFGESPYTSAVNNSLTDPGLVIKWIWKGYDERNDQYVADYEITSTKIDNYSETGTVYMKKANNNAEKLSNGVTKLTAKATSANYPTISFEDIRNVKAPAWAWTTDYEKATASFKESEDDWKTPETPSTITKVDNTIVHGPYIVEKDTPTEKYYMRDHEASVVFCGNEFPVTETQHKIIPTYDIPKVTVTPTPTLPPGVTATPTPTLKPGTTATPTPYSKHTVSWTWDDYKERLNNTSANETPNKGNFEKATAILTDDQTGYFTKELVADGKKTGTGGITITTPATNSSPISFKAAVENVKSNGTKEALNDTLSFGYPKKADWDWAGVTSATVTFKESKGKTFGKDNESTVAITTKDIEHVADLTKTVYTATAYFGTHPYTDVLEVNTDYVVYLRWPSSWNTAQYDPDYQYNKRKNPFKVYCYVYDDNGNDNGTTMSDKGVEVKGELMDVVVKGRTGRFFNYPLAAGSFENPSVKFYNALGVELPTPDVQSIVGDKVTDVGTKLTMTEKGDWLYYEAALETASAKNTWKKYLPEINGHALTVVDSGILGMDFYFDIPERYGSSGTVVISAREEEGHPSRFTYNSQSRLSDGRFLFSRDVLIARIANDIYVDLTYGSGANMAHLTETYSVEKYLTTGIERADAGLPQYQKVANVLRTINDYGWYAQMALNMDANEDPTPLTKCYGAPALMSIEEATKLLEPYKFVVEKQASDVTGFKYPLACWEDARINLYTYTPDKTVQAEVIDREAQAEGFEFEPALIDNKYQTKGGRYMYTLLGIPLDSLDKWFRFRITTDGGESIVKVSALSNQYRNIADTTGEVSQDSKNLSLAIVNVWKELNAFFES